MIPQAFRRVYVVNSGVHDINRALKRTQQIAPNTQIIPLTEGMLDSSQIDRVSYQMAENLWDFNGQEDALLLSGHAAANMIALSLCYAVHSEVNVLIHRKNLEYYEIRTFNTEWFQSLIEEAAVRNHDMILRDQDLDPFRVFGPEMEPKNIPVDF